MIAERSSTCHLLLSTCHYARRVLIELTAFVVKYLYFKRKALTLWHHNPLPVGIGQQMFLRIMSFFIQCHLKRVYESLSSLVGRIITLYLALS